MPLRRLPKVVCLVIKCVCVVFYVICFVIEYTTYLDLYNHIDGVCVKFYGVSKVVHPMLVWAAVPIFPDLLFAVTGLPLFKLHNHPFCIVYNLAIGVLLCVNAGNMQMGLTYCAQPLQPLVFTFGTRFHVAGIFHFVMPVFTLLLYDEGELYIWKKITSQSIKDHKN